ncbi:MAG: MraY family glycosyltransferase [Pseudomonadota bacterium]
MESSVMAAACLAVFGFGVTCATTPFAGRVAYKHGFVAVPGGRRTHSEPTPLLGGLAVYVPFAVVFAAFVVSSATGFISIEQPSGSKILSLFVAATWVLILGSLDDRKPLGWRKKLIGQTVGALILVFGGHTIAWATIPIFGLVDFGWAGPLLFVLAVIVLTNAINLIDGMDGLATGICFFASLTSSIIGLAKGDLFTAAIGFTLSGSLLGFLLFNLPPASMFLGDGGSMMLGFVLGTLATSSAAISPGQRLGTAVMVLVPFLPFGIPVFEVVLSIFRRWINGQAIFLGDGNHLHHRLVRKMKNHTLTLGIFYLFSAALCSLTLILVLDVNSPLLRAMAGIIVVLLFGGAVASLTLYPLDRLFTTIKNRRHFKFLGSFLSFMKNRLTRAQSLDELIEVIQTGVRDLDFDYVEVVVNGKVMRRWDNPRPVHPDNRRIHCEETLDDLSLAIKWGRPLHDDDFYNEYLMLTWYRFIVEFRAKVRSQTGTVTCRHTAPNHIRSAG